MFQIEQVTKLCSKTALTEPWDPYDIPDNSTYEDQYYIGSPGDKIMVQEWSDRKPTRKRKLLEVHNYFYTSVQILHSHSTKNQ